MRHAFCLFCAVSIAACGAAQTQVAESEPTENAEVPCSDAPAPSSRPAEGAAADKEPAAESAKTDEEPAQVEENHENSASTIGNDDDGDGGD